VSHKKSLQESVRNDGLRIITKRVSGTKKVYLAVTALVGSAYDPFNQHGLFHLFEHMAFKGTATKSARDIKKILEQYALINNASTNRLETTYWALGVSTRLSEISNLLFDMYLNPSFLPDELEKEKEVVGNEIARNFDNDSWFATNTLMGALWKDNPLGHFYTTGIPEELATVTSDTLSGAHSRWYIPSNTVVVATGKLDHEELKQLAFKAFPLNSQIVSHTTWSDEYNEKLEEHEIIIERPSRNKAIVLWGLKIPRLSEKEEAHIEFYIRMLAVGMGSLFWREVRENRGLVYTISGAHGGHPKLGKYLMFAAETLPERVGEVKELIHELVTTHSLQDAAQFNRVKMRLTDLQSVSPESLDGWYNLIDAGMVKEGWDRETFEKNIRNERKQIKATRLEDVIALREKLIVPEQMVSVVLKPE